MSTSFDFGFILAFDTRLSSYLRIVIELKLSEWHIQATMHKLKKYTKIMSCIKNRNKTYLNN